MSKPTYKNSRRLAFCVLLILVMTAVGMLFSSHWISTTSKSLYDQHTQQGSIYDCVTGEIRGVMPLNRTLVPLATLAGESLESRETSRVAFHEAFNKRVWGRTISGYTAKVQFAGLAEKALDAVIRRIKTKFGLTKVKMLDIPCGDMTWMSHFLANRDDVDYTGFDIVPELIQSHQRNLSVQHPNWKFKLRDILSDEPLESYDLVLSRLMLVNFVYHNVLRFLDVISKSGSQFLLTTTCPTIDQNSELTNREGARYRSLNLQAPPVSLSPPICYAKDGLEKDYHFYLALWKLPLSQVADCQTASATSLPLWNTTLRYFACG